MFVVRSCMIFARSQQDLARFLQDLIKIQRDINKDFAGSCDILQDHDMYQGKTMKSSYTGSCQDLAGILARLSTWARPARGGGKIPGAQTGLEGPKS